MPTDASQTIDPAPDQDHADDGGGTDRRWIVLAVLCLSVFLIVVDNTIVNVALPTLVRDLGATTSELQWIVDAYTLVFAGLLLVGGSLGDRYGRKGALQIGMLIFGTFSALAAIVQSPEQLIAMRGLMGVGAALIFPATLAILVSVFRDPRDRAKAIGIWAAVSGLAVALGPVVGGWLLEHFFWGSVFVVNVPIVIVAVVANQFLVPTSRDNHVPRFDVVGIVASIVGVTLLVFTIIEAPTWGWSSPATIAGLGGAAVLLTSFILWERRSSHPMLDVRVFANARFSAGSMAVTLAFFALFGFIFMVTQYFQFVRGYGTFESGLRTVPFALFTGVAAPIAAKVALRIGTKVVVAAGLFSMGIGLAISGSLAVDSSYWLIVLAMAFMGGGLGLVNAPATEAIMGSLPPDKAGVGSAVNDTTRELGGTLGVAIIGSLFASAYRASLTDALTGTPMPAEALSIATESVGAGAAVAQQAAATAGPQAGQFVGDAVNTAFMGGFRIGSFVGAGVVVAASVLALVFLPARSSAVDTAEDPDVRPGADPLLEGDADLTTVDLTAPVIDLAPAAAR